MYTSALAGGVTETEIRYIYLYTRNRMMMMMTTTMTMLLTTGTVVYILANKMSENRNNLEDTGTLPYYLDLPDGQLMIGGSKGVGTLGRLDAELIADNKREKKLLGLSVILSPWGRPNQKEKLTTGLQYTALSLSLFLFHSYYSVLKRKIVGWSVIYQIIIRLVFSS